MKIRISLLLILRGGMPPDVTTENITTFVRAVKGMD